jgi:peroxiredoxin
MVFNIRYALLSLSVLIFFVSCEKTATVRGKIENADNHLLELSLNTSPKKIVDTVRLKPSGEFNFKYRFGKNIYPVSMLLSLANKPLVSLLLEPDDKARIEIDAKNTRNYKISGSEGSQLLKELNDYTLAISISIDSLIALLGKQENTPEYELAVEKTNKEMSGIYTKYKRNLVRFIVKNNKSYAAYYALYQTIRGEMPVFGKESDALYFKMIADSLEQKYPHSPYVYRLRDDYKNLIQANTIKNMVENAENASFPDISMPDATGTKIALSSLKGKIILLNFWVSSDRASATNNIEMLPLYEKYHAQGFEIYNVSLDENRELWLYTINNQKLPWINVCDFRGAESSAALLYNLSKLPANYLIDRDGEIAGKDLFGQNLENKIKSLF